MEWCVMGDREPPADADSGLILQVVLVADPQVDAETVDLLTRRLRAEIADLGVESVELAPGTPSPPLAKAADPVTVGAIVVALSASGGVLTALVGLLGDWLGRQHSRHRISVTIDGDTIELERASAAERSTLVETFVRQHTEGH